MYQYRIFRRVGVTLWRIALGIGAIIAFTVAVDLVRLYGLLARIHPIVAWCYAGLLGAVSVVLLWKFVSFRQDHRALHPRPLPPADEARHKDLVTHCRHLAMVLRRLSRNACLNEEQQRLALQTAYDTEEPLGHHPLLEDLHMSIGKADATLATLWATLDEQARAVTRDKMKAVVADVIHPPFPVVNAVVVLYHQFTLTTSLTGIYVTSPALLEYWIVLRDVWRVMTRGDFIRVGQALFSGVYANCPPMGKAIEDLGQAISSIWLAQSTAQATLDRCKATRGWDVEGAIALMDSKCMASLVTTRDVLIRDILPMLKTAFHHKVPRGSDESPTFLSTLVQGITRAVDTVIHGWQAAPIAETVQNTRRAAAPMPGEVPAHGELQRVRRRSRRHRSGHAKGNGLSRILRNLSQKFRYGSRYPRS